VEIEEAWALRNADPRSAAVVTFAPQRIKIVAEELQRQHSPETLVIAPVRGGEPQAQEIAESLECFWIELPSDKPHGYSVNHYGLEFGYDALLTLTQQLKAPPLRYQLLTSSQLLALPPQRWMINGVLPREGLGALFGPSGSGKSFLTLDIAATVASGGGNGSGGGDSIPPSHTFAWKAKLG